MANKPRGRPRRDFWRQEPSIPDVAETAEVGGGADRLTGDRQAEPIRSQTFHGVPLVDGVTLLLASSRPIDAADFEAIRTAAGPLIEILLRRQLIHPHEEGDTR